jgi:hypothetical protein
MFDPPLRQSPDLCNLLGRPGLFDESATVSDPEGFLRHPDFVHVELQAIPKKIVGTLGVQARCRPIDLVAHRIPPQWIF